MDREQNYFDALLADYVASRDDERELNNQLVGVFSGVVATLTLFGAFVTFVGSEKPTIRIPDEAAATVPLIPLALGCMLQITSSIATARSFYGRAIERELSTMLPATIPDLAGYPHLKALTYREMIVELNSLSRGFRIPRFLQITAIISLLFIFVVLVCYMARDYAFYLQFTMLVVYGPIVTLLAVEGLNATVRGRTYFLKLVKDTRVRRTYSLLPETRPSLDERSLFSYLLLPRPMDLSKALFFLIGVLVLVAIQPPILQVPFLVPRALVLWFILEILMYQGRYQLNDLRGLSEDQESPAAAQRGRIPTLAVGSRIAAFATLGAIFIRFALVIILCGLPFISFFHHVAPMAIGVITLAIVYERVRSIERNCFDTSTDGQASIGAGWTVIALVGLGYPLRTILGLTLPQTTGGGRDIPWDWKWPWNSTLPGEDGWRPPSFHFDIPMRLVTELGLYTFWLGIVFVSMTWCLEGGTYVNRRLRLNGRTIHFTKSSIGRKSHLLILLRQTRSNVAYGQPLFLAGHRQYQFDGPRNRWLNRNSKPFAVWNIGLTCATFMAVILTAELWDIGYEIGQLLYWVTAAATAAVLVVWQLLPPRAGNLFSGISLALVAASAVVACVDSPRRMMDSLPLCATILTFALSVAAFLVPTFMYRMFHGISYDDLKLPPFLSAASINKIPGMVFALIVGRRLARTLWPPTP
ncbi:hypothetical protein [Nocardia gamkensis]|uniref:Uncharacterized protein n=1 Tax=Nocardia gamkensis TaxID=352869 RepID=A0A7X6LBG3_9NOCA|nr:hypothetical protein [Nocardia gamkensis]NKY31426.1 hypothetical protein [Nocardia gamkensis]NQE72595.1 hypothetical protein [Nocardia gamkensis]